MTAAAIYARLSQNRTEESLGIDRQLAQCRELATSRGLPVVGTFTDDGVSGFKGSQRPGFSALLEAVASGSVEVVVAFNTDRLYRNDEDQLAFLALARRHRVRVLTVTGGDMDPNSPTGALSLGLTGVIANYESMVKSARIVAKQRQMATRGEWIGGAPRPFGWDVDGKTVTVNEPEAAQIRAAYEYLLAGGSVSGLVRQWATSGLPPVSGKGWVYNTVRQVLLRPRNYGAVEYRGEVLSVGVWPAIVSQDQWEAVRAVLRDPVRRSGGGNRPVHLLSGLAVCGVCGGPMGAVSIRTRARQDGTGGGYRPVYRCRTRGGSVRHPARDAAALDGFVSDLVVGVLSDPAWAHAFQAQRGDSSRADGERLAVVRGRLDDLADAFALGEISREQMVRASARLREQSRQLQESLESAAASTSAAGALAGASDVAARWAALDIQTRRAVVRELVRVVVLPGARGRGFDPAFVRVEWVYTDGERS